MANSFDNELETPAMETLASLAENLVYRLPGCDDLMIRKTLQEVYRDFCRRSCCLCGRRHFGISYEEPDVFVNPMFGGVIDSISEVRYNGRRLGSRDYVEHGNRISFRDGLVPDPGCGEDDLPKIDVCFVEMPRMGSEEVSSSFIAKYGDALCSGVLFRLKRMTGRAWSDAAEAKASAIEYENAVNAARVGYHAGNSSGDCEIGIDTSALI